MVNLILGSILLWDLVIHCIPSGCAWCRPGNSLSGPRRALPGSCFGDSYLARGEAATHSSSSCSLLPSWTHRSLWVWTDTSFPFAGVLKFARLVKSYEAQDPEIASLSGKLKALFLPPMTLPPHGPASGGSVAAS